MNRASTVTNASGRNSKLIPGTVSDSNFFTEQIFKFIMHNNAQELSDLLTKSGNAINVMEMKDVRNFTVIAFASYKNHEECFMTLFNHALEVNLRDDDISFNRKQEIIGMWVNTPTDEEFTALHFAAYHGNFYLSKFLIEHGKADIFKKNKFGSTLMHVAA